LRLYLDNSFETPWARSQWEKIVDVWKDRTSLIICDSIQNADAILITITDPNGNYDNIIRSIAASKSYAALADRLFVFDSQEGTLGLFPGVYASLRSYLFRYYRHRAGCFLQSFNEFITYTEPSEANIKYLFSFQGNLTAGVRKMLFSTNFGRSDVLIERTQPFWDKIGSPEMEHFKKQYAEVIACSRFVLCPRGISPASYRLFETMQSGRVPVIISDKWVLPSKIEWNKFSLRVREKDISQISDICLDASNRWTAMALEARKIWEEWFSHLGLAKLIETSIQDLQRTRKFPERVVRTFDWPMRRALARGRRFAVRSLSAAAAYVRK
jgi:hypothetical protein